MTNRYFQKYLVKRYTSVYSSEHKIIPAHVRYTNVRYADARYADARYAHLRYTGCEVYRM